MGDLHEDIFQRRAARDSSRTSQRRSLARRENFRSHIRPRFHSERKNLPAVILRLAHIPHARDFLQLPTAVIRADFCFQRHAAGRPNPAEQIFRRVAGFDPSLC